MVSLHVSEGNGKLGAVANVSLLPIVTCDRCAGCSKPRPGNTKVQCYPTKAMRLYPSVRIAWSDNTKLAKDAARFFAELGDWFAGQVHVEWFRFMVAGDCPTAEFVRELVAFCRQHPATKFLLFTKRYKWFNRFSALPANLTVVYSAWPGFKMVNPKGRPVAWLADERQPDSRIPVTARPCPGSCDGCMICWGLGSGQDVVFHAH